MRRNFEGISGIALVSVAWCLWVGAGAALAQDCTCGGFGCPPGDCELAWCGGQEGCSNYCGVENCSCQAVCPEYTALPCDGENIDECYCRGGEQCDYCPFRCPSQGGGWEPCSGDPGCGCSYTGCRQNCCYGGVHCWEQSCETDYWCEARPCDCTGYCYDFTPADYPPCDYNEKNCTCGGGRDVAVRSARRGASSVPRRTTSRAAVAGSVNASERPNRAAPRCARNTARTSLRVRRRAARSSTAGTSPNGLTPIRAGAEKMARDGATVKGWRRQLAGLTHAPTKTRATTAGEIPPGRSPAPRRATGAVAVANTWARSSQAVRRSAQEGPGVSRTRQAGSRTSTATAATAPAVPTRRGNTAHSKSTATAPRRRATSQSGLGVGEGAKCAAGTIPAAAQAMPHAAETAAWAARDASAMPTATATGKTGAEARGQGLVVTRTAHDADAAPQAHNAIGGRDNR